MLLASFIGIKAITMSHCISIFSRYDKKTLDSSVKEEVVGNDIKSDQDIEKSLQEVYFCSG